jgi:amino acid adenylation domain-containing protein/non-ribosomal peptide synthase protein (TIGR01720 family)
LIELLQLRAERQPERTAFTFLTDGETEETRLTYQELDRQARAVGAQLQQQGAAGERVLLLFPPGLEYISAFFGCLYAGAVAVPAYPPRRNRSLSRLQAVVDDAQAKLVLTTSAHLNRFASWAADFQRLGNLQWLATDNIPSELSDGWRQPTLSGDSLALLQYTSGSTADPKGVMVSHGNLLYNEWMINQAFQLSARSIVVGWLPLYHDMGLIGNMLQTLYAGACCIFMSPTAFLQSPARWLKTISRYRATVSGGPNFAYDLCARKIKVEQRAGLDLSCWDVAFNGAEPVRAETLDRFAIEFEPYGFRRTSFRPCYGLAEATLIVSGSDNFSDPVICHFDAAALERHEVLEVDENSPGENVKRLVSSGRISAQKVVIANPQSLTECAPAEVGEIWVTGQSVAHGYWNNPDATRQTFQAQLADSREGPFLRTGDLGFLSGGELFVTGRIKDLIIIRGRNHYPHDIELTVERRLPSRQSNSVAAFSVEADGEERLALVSEVDARFHTELDRIISDVRQAISEEHELQAYSIALVKPGSIPRTSSGKIRRRACRAHFLSDSLPVVAEWRESAESEDHGAFQNISFESVADVEAWLRSEVAVKLGVKASEIDTRQPIARYGVDSLTAIELSHSIESALRVKLSPTDLFQSSGLSQLAAQAFYSLQESPLNDRVSSATAPEVRDGYPLSYGQKALIFLHQLNSESPAYNIAQAVVFRTGLDLTVLRDSFQELMDRHAALRTTFVAARSEIAQRIHDHMEVCFRFEDASMCNEATLRNRLTEEADRPFDLGRGPLLRLNVFLRPDRKHVLLLVIHHIVADFWSLAVIAHELGAIYAARNRRTAAILPPLNRQYVDYVLWRQRALEGPEGELGWSYWRKQLAALPPALDLPADRPRPPVQTYHGASYNFEFDATLTAALKTFIRACDGTLHLVLLTAFKVLLCRYTGQEDILVGSPFSGREQAESAGTVGYFVNTLPLRTKLNGNPSFKAALARVRETALAAFRHQNFPFPLLVERLQPERDPSRSPFFQVVFVTQKAPARIGQDLTALALGRAGALASVGGIEFESLALKRRSAQFDLTLSVAEVEENCVAASFQYNTDLFNAGAIERMANHFEHLLRGVIADPERQLSELPLLTEIEQAQILSQWDTTRMAYRSDARLGDLFTARAERAPQSIAVTFGDESLTYGELNQRANQIAHYLRQLGVGPESAVGLCLERSAEMVIAILGVIKAGGAYVPLNPDDPSERLSYILNDSCASVLLTKRRLLPHLAPCQAHVVCLDADEGAIACQSRENLIVDVAAESVAYVIYTSGSTGRPKGVAVTHANVTRLFEATRQWFNFDGRDTWTLFHSCAFDFSVWEMWGALLHGGRLVIVPYLTSRSPEAFYEALSSECVTVLNQTPSAFRQLMLAEAAACAHKPLALRLIIFGGEALEFQSLGPWLERHGHDDPKLVNMYGITETTVHVTYRRLRVADLERGSGSIIGQAIPDLRVYILDRHQQLAPVGVPGEIFVGGAGLSRGYLNKADLTAERFIPDTFTAVEGARLYRSGDRAKYLPDGDMEYMGRIDQQIKLRGFRIEPGEIEYVLSQHPAVREAVVNARDEAPGAQNLVAYIVSHKQKAPTVTDLRRFMEASLPDYMIPSAFVFLDSIPLTSNGKVDRRALPEPDTARPELAETFAAPANQIESTLAEIWAQVLKIERVGTQDNFFDLGGDSIRSIQVKALAEERGLSFSLSQLFRYQTISQLAREIGAGNEIDGLAPRPEPFTLCSAQDAAKTPPDVEDAYPLAKLQAGLVFHSQHDRSYLSYVTSLRLRARFDAAAMQEASEQMVARHQMLRTSFDLVNFSEPLQLVHKSAKLHVRVEDLRGRPPSEAEETIAAWIESEMRARVDWTRPPLLRLHVHRRTDETFQFTLCEPFFDGWSVASLLTEFFTRYFALLKGASLPIEQPAASFRDYVALELAAMKSPEQQLYWERKLDGFAADRPMFLSRANGDSEGLPIRRFHVNVPGEDSDALKEMARAAGAPLKSVLIAAHLKVMSLMTAQEDVITGLLCNGRPEIRDGETVLGIFLNAVPFRLAVTGGSWLDLARRAFAAEQELAPFRRYPLAELQRRHGGRQLFETVFNFTHFHIYQGLDEIEGTQVLDAFASEQTYFDLTAQFNLDHTTSHLRLALDFNAAALQSDDVERIAGYYAQTLAVMAANPLDHHGAQCLLSAAERRQILIEWNGATVFPSASDCIHELFERQAARTPAAIALIYGSECLTYERLNERANRLARYLLSLGVGPETLVGICIERSDDMVVGVLAVLKAGGAYVPLDPSYPAERLAFIMEDCKMRVALASQRAMPCLPSSQARTVCFEIDGEAISRQSEQNLERTTLPQNLAYLIYTSGSTGQPKGVAIQHASAVILLRWARETFGPEELYRALASTSICFDLSVFELFVPLSFGGAVVLADNVLQIPDLPAADQITLINTVPSAMAELARSEGVPSTVRVVNLAGEPLSRRLAQQLYRTGTVKRVLNLYGPSEDTTYSTWAVVEMDEDLSPPIGRPIANTQAYLLDHNLQPGPAGVAAELYLGGDGLARGYYNRPDQTAARFIPDPFAAPGSRMYKTGDLARYRHDGQLEFLGRLDHQVKIRGFRIELGEIETTLRQHPNIRDAVMSVTGEGDEKRLVAYVVSDHQKPITSSQLRDFLHTKLPGYAIPSVFVSMKALPLTPNGKVDRRRLPESLEEEETGAVWLKEHYVAPRTPVEEALASVWRQSLGIERVGVRNNFFELGGDSIQALQVVAKAGRAGIRLRTHDLFENPTIENLAQVVTLTSTHSADQSSVTGPVLLTPIQRWFFEHDLPKPQHWNQAVLLEVSPDLPSEILQEAARRLISHHDALRMRFRKIGSEWEQMTAPPGEEMAFSPHDLSRMDDAGQWRSLERLATEAQASLNLAEGPLFRLVLFELGAHRGRRLLIIANHLVVDGVSFRVILEDLQTACNQLSGGAPVQFPPKTTSFQRWAQRLSEYARSSELLGEADYWLRQRSDDGGLPPVDHSRGKNIERFAKTVSASLTEQETQLLLQHAPSVYRAQINDILLSALTLTITNWTGRPSLLVDLEGHGREDVFDDVDVSRTVGWFTSIFPVRLDLGDADTPQAALRVVKEQLRRIPHRGFGYGILRYLCQKEELVTKLRSAQRAGIRFNYLGQFDQVLTISDFFRPAGESYGQLYDRDGERSHLLQVVGSVIGGRLRMNWTYSENFHRRETVESLARDFIEVLRRLTVPGAADESVGLSPSDFPEAELSQADFEKLLAQLTREQPA